MKTGLNAVKVVRVQPGMIPAVLASYAECYCQIWKEEPWCEDFWKTETVIRDLEEFMLKDGAIGFLAMIDLEVVGFTLGYTADRDQLRSISGTDNMDELALKYGKLFYVAELGVAAGWRGKHISSLLTESLIGAALESGISSFVLRTDIRAKAARHVYAKLGFIELSVHDAVHADRTYWFKTGSLQSFKDLFAFDRDKSLHVGIERECFLTDLSGNIVPWAPSLLRRLPEPRYSYELSACQLETRIGPCRIEDIRHNLLEIESEINGLEKDLGFQRSFVEVGPEDMPLDVYPDPSGRYQRIVKTMPRQILLAACRVIGTHVHIGMPDHETAIRVYNQVVTNYDRLCQLGNGSFGERLDIYRIVAPDCKPSPYKDWLDLYKTACEKGFVEDPRKCWTLIRISKHGTLEFRMFGATRSIDRIVSWAETCHNLCKTAM